MKNFKYRKLFLLFILIVAFQFSNAQEKYSAIVSQDGTLNLKITFDDFYFSISQLGEITDFGSSASGNISYNANGSVDRIGSTSISYNAYKKIERVGFRSFSYDAMQRITSIGSISFSYNAYNKIGTFSNKNVLYNAYNKVSNIGSATISYNAYGNVSDINSSENFIFLKPKL